MKGAERAAIPAPRASRADEIRDGDNFSHGRTFDGHHVLRPTRICTFDRSESPSCAEIGQSARPPPYIGIASQSSSTLPIHPVGPHLSRQIPISLEGMPLNENERKCWDEIRETAGNLADTASFVHQTERAPSRNDLDWMRSNFQIFAKNMLLCRVLHGEDPQVSNAVLASHKMTDPSQYTRKLVSQSPTKSWTIRALQTPFSFPPLNRQVSYDKIIAPDRTMRLSTSLTNLTGERCDVPLNRTPSLLHDHREPNRFVVGPGKMELQYTSWRQLNSESSKARGKGHPEILPKSSLPRDRASSGKVDRYAPSIEQEYPSGMAGPSGLYDTVPLTLAFPLSYFPRHPHNSLRLAPCARETNESNQKSPFPSHHNGGIMSGFPVPQTPSHGSLPGRRAFSDFERKSHPTGYCSPYNISSDEQYDLRPPFYHHSAQHGARASSGYHGDEYKDANRHDESYVSGDENGHMRLRPLKYRKRSRARAPDNCDCCGVRDTPEWRRGPNGARTVCNACGLYFSKLVRRRISRDESATVTIEELRSSLKIPERVL